MLSAYELNRAGPEKGRALFLFTTPDFRGQSIYGGKNGESQRIAIFKFIIDEIRKYSDCPVALCKESSSVWQEVGLDLSKCKCVCQLDFADLST
jgi:hypothetical protein